MLITVVSLNRKALKQFLRVLELHYPVSYEYTGAGLEAVIPDELEVGITSLFNLVQHDCGLTIEQIRDCRHKTYDVVAARDVLLFLLNKYYKLTTTSCARLVGAKSHASTIQAIRKFGSPPYGKSLQSVYKNAKRSYFRPWPKEKKLANRLLQMRPTNNNSSAK